MKTNPIAFGSTNIFSAVITVMVLFCTRQTTAINCDTQKEIIVSTTGIDNAACLLGIDLDKHCHTLEYVLLNSTSLDCTKISVTYDQEIRNTVSKTNISGLSIVGNETRLTQVTCEHKYVDLLVAGFLYVESEDIELVNISWHNCTLDYEGDWTSSMAGIFFHNCMNIHIVGCQFIGSKGTGLFLHNVGGNVLINSSSFTENGDNDCIPGICNSAAAGLRIQFSYCARNDDCNDSKFKSHANYTIDNCFFTSNHEQSVLNFIDCYNTPEGRGAGLSLYLGGGSTYNTFTIRSCNFSHNVANGEGGGMSAEIFGPNSTSNMIYITDSVFYKNRADTFGGGIHSCVLSPHNENDQTTSNNTLLIQNSTFNGNQAAGTAGGGCSFYTNSGVTTLNNITFINDTWMNNTAQHFGSAVLLQLSYYSIDATTNVSFHSCNFSGNKLQNMFYQEDQEPMGAVYAENVTVSFIGTTNFSNNVGSALAVNSATAYIYGHATFERNSGVYGGAIILIGKAWITVTKYCHINFTHNYALFLGGAIDSHLASDCIFKYMAQNKLEPKYWKANISFYYNIANTYDNAIFIGDPDHCYPAIDPVTKKSIPYFEYYREVFSFVPNVTCGQVATGAKNIIFSNQSTLKATLGEPFIVHPVAVDVYGNPTFAYGQVLLNSSIQQLSPYQLHGPGFVLMNENSTFYVTGPVNATEHFRQQGLLVVIHGTVLKNTTSLQILNGCQPGYIYDKKQQMCVHAESDRLSMNLYYPSENSGACIRYGYWFGVINESVVLSPCPSTFCNYQKRCYSSTNICSRPGFCLLPEDQCNEGRTGVLCSSCKANYSFTLDASQCVSSCSTDHVILIVVVILIYWLLFVIFLLLILKFTIGHGLGSGYVFVILYYFSVLQISISENWPSKPLRLFTKFFIAFTQFSPQMLGEWGTCFGKNWNSLDYELFNYTTSIVVSFVITSVVLIERCCRCPKLISPAKNSPIRLFCILILLSYTSLTQSSFEIMKVVKFNDIDTYYVSIKPDVVYMSRDHLKYAVIALCIELLILFPFSILVLFASCLEVRLNYVKLRIKAIVDELQASFRSKCRWFAGFYLVCRQLLYLTTWIPHPVAMSYVMIILHVMVFVVHVYFMPYRDMWLNRIDTFFLLDLILLSSLNSPTSTFASAIPGSDKFQDVMVYILILLPCAYCIVIIGILAAKWCASHCKKKPLKFNIDNSNNSDLIIAYSYNREHNCKGPGALKVKTDSNSSSERDPLLN